MTTLRGTLLAISVCIAPLTVCSLTMRAQTPSANASPSSADAKTVTMAVTVLDKHGDPVANLTKDDFTLTNDGHPQAIQSFRSASGLPLTLGLVVDTETGQGNALEAERAASKAFIGQMLTDPRDKAFVIQYASEVDLLADVTPEKSKVDAALGQLGTPQPHNTAGDAQGSGNGSPHLGGAGATLYDAIYLASTELMQKQHGRKALIVLSDGVDRGSKESLFSAIEAAQRANTAVYALYFKGEKQRKNNGGFPGRRGGPTGGGYPGSGRYPGGYPGGYPGSGGGWPGGGGGRPSRPTEGTNIDGRKVLAQICRETGGGSFEVSGKHPVSQIYSAIAGQLRGQYLLSFTPDIKSSYGGFHHVALAMKNKDLYAQTRHGYYSGE